MNPRVTIGLLVVLAALGAGVWFSEFRDPSSTPSTSSPSSPGGAPAAPAPTVDPLLQMFQIDDKEVVKLEFLKGGVTTIVTKDGDDWFLQPSGELAERFRVNSLLVRVATLKANRRIAEPEAMEIYGLASPEMIMRLWRQDDSLYELIVGGKTPNDAGTYARRPDDPAVFVLPNTVTGDIEKMVTEPPKAPATATPFPTSTATPTP